MIEVLREGNKKKIECDECGALLRYEKEDIHELSASVLGMYHKQTYITCPQCNSRIILEAQR